MKKKPPAGLHHTESQSGEDPYRPPSCIGLFSENGTMQAAVLHGSIFRKSYLYMGRHDPWPGTSSENHTHARVRGSKGAISQMVPSDTSVLPVTQKLYALRVCAGPCSHELIGTLRTARAWVCSDVFISLRNAWLIMILDT